MWEGALGNLPLVLVGIVSPRLLFLELGSGALQPEERQARRRHTRPFVYHFHVG